MNRYFGLISPVFCLSLFVPVELYIACSVVVELCTAFSGPKHGQKTCHKSGHFPKCFCERHGAKSLNKHLQYVGKLTNWLAYLQFAIFLEELEEGFLNLCNICSVNVRSIFRTPLEKKRKSSQKPVKAFEKHLKGQRHRPGKPDAPPEKPEQKRREEKRTGFYHWQTLMTYVPSITMFF